LLQTDGIDFTYYKATHPLKLSEFCGDGSVQLGHTLRLRSISPNPTLKKQKPLSRSMLPVSFFLSKDSRSISSLNLSRYSQHNAHQSAQWPQSGSGWRGVLTGEEVYSIAICLLEFFDTRKLCQNQDFGIRKWNPWPRKARSRTYIPSMAGADFTWTSATLLSAGGRIDQQAYPPDVYVFTNKTYSADPPFFPLDLISCRNVSSISSTSWVARCRRSIASNQQAFLLEPQRLRRKFRFIYLVDKS